jgi:hypothetical protein
MKTFLERLNSYVERVAVLPDKVIDTKLLLMVQLVICLIVYSSILAAQMRIVDRCIVPLPSSFIK